jgi:hypothetical protein
MVCSFLFSAFGPNSRHPTSPLTLLLSRAIQFPVTKALPYIFTSFGYGTWFFFACWMLLATFWAFFLVPETKGLTVDQMDLIFGYKNDRPYRIPHTSMTTRMLREMQLQNERDMETTKLGGEGGGKTAVHAESREESV